MGAAILITGLHWRGKSEPGHGTDLEAIAAKRISITPLRLDLTDEPTLTRYASLFS